MKNMLTAVLLCLSVAAAAQACTCPKARRLYNQLALDELRHLLTLVSVMDGLADDCLTQLDLNFPPGELPDPVPQTEDSILRWYRMNGRDVLDRAGYDMHGLPIEVKVEQALGFGSKKDIETFGIQPFIERCREFATKNKVLMDEQFENLGVWLDFANAYQTVMPEYIEAAWWTLARADEKGMLERGHRVVNWCPRCETAIADSEVEYWDERDPSIFEFKVIG
jgi:hypothetical protein